MIVIFEVVSEKELQDLVSRKIEQVLITFYIVESKVDKLVVVSIIIVLKDLIKVLLLDR